MSPPTAPQPTPSTETDAPVRPSMRCSIDASSWCRYSKLRSSPCPPAPSVLARGAREATVLRARLGLLEINPLGDRQPLEMAAEAVEPELDRAQTHPLAAADD